jgi:predicted enzyme related to lactoylglutathione lyase
MLVNAPLLNTPIWNDLATPDPEGARAFYGKVLGWTFGIGGPETGFYAMCEAKGLPAAGIGGIPEGSPMPTAWSVYFGVENVEATLEAIQAAGGGVVAPPMDIMEFGRMAFCVDPDGAHFGLWQPKLHIGRRIQDEVGAVCWCEVNSRNGEANGAFYAKVFGLSTAKMEGMEYWIMNHGETPVGGVLQMNEQWGDMPPCWSVYFAVENVEASLEVINGAGGKMLVPPFDTPYGRMSVVQDPFGAVFSIMAMVQPA